MIPWLDRLFANNGNQGGILGGYVPPNVASPSDRHAPEWVNGLPPGPRDVEPMPGDDQPQQTRGISDSMRWPWMMVHQAVPTASPAAASSPMPSASPSVPPAAPQP